MLQLAGLLLKYSVSYMLSSFYNSFEDSAPADEIYRYMIFKTVPLSGLLR